MSECLNKWSLYWYKVYLAGYIFLSIKYAYLPAWLVSCSMFKYRHLHSIITLYYRLHFIILDIYKCIFHMWALIPYLFPNYIQCCIHLFCSSVWFSLVVNVWCCRNWRFVFVVWFAVQGESNETRIAVANQRAHDLLK